MKTFLTYLDEYTNSLGTYATGGASTGPGMGQYVPTADLNAKRILEYLERKVNQQGQTSTLICIQTKIQKELYMD